ncbi:hypothetical protein [Paracoccus versutus]|uniref:hypothetical protein n=1 Tax=Paracoccus versutus TaxID=34007 RepID=UPI001C688DCB|nr:hypothetical protein [Paracoccus versutus]
MFQAHGAAADGTVVFRRKLFRAQLLIAETASQPTMRLSAVKGEALRRLFGDLEGSSGLLDGAQQGHLRQPDEHPPRRAGSAGAERPAHPPGQPDLFAEFCDAYTRETNRLRMESGAGIDKAETELKRIAREEEKLMDLYMRDAISIEAVKERGDKLRARKVELQDFLANADEPPPLLHPNMALQYRARVQQLYETLQGDDEAQRIEAAEIIRSLVDRIVLTPGEDRIEIDVQGDLAGILTISAQTKKPAEGAGGSQVKMVAGARFQKYLPLHHGGWQPAGSLAA